MYALRSPPLRTLVLLLPLFLVSGIAAQGTTGNGCVVKSSGAWGKPSERCSVYSEGFRRDNTNTFTVELTNTCREVMEVKAAVQEADGMWRTYPVRVLAQFESFTVQACKGSGRYMFWTKRLDDPGVVLPSDATILVEYRDQ